MYSMRSYGARFIMGETVEKIENLGDRAVVYLSTGTAEAREEDSRGQALIGCVCHLMCVCVCVRQARGGGGRAVYHGPAGQHRE